MPPMLGMPCIPGMLWFGCIIAMLRQHEHPLDGWACWPGCAGVACAAGLGRAHIIPPIAGACWVVLPVVAAVCCIIPQASAGVLMTATSAARVIVVVFIERSSKLLNKGRAWVRLDAAFGYRCSSFRRTVARTNHHGQQDRHCGWLQHRAGSQWADLQVGSDQSDAAQDHAAGAYIGGGLLG